jgi:hypothetical protein
MVTHLEKTRRLWCDNNIFRKIRDFTSVRRLVSDNESGIDIEEVMV